MELNNEQIRQILDGDGTYRQKYYRIYGENVSKDTARHRLNRLRERIDGNYVVDQCANVFKEKININSNGQQCSEKLLECSNEQLKDPEYLLQMHGYDTKKFQLVSATASIWQTSASTGKVLYSSKIHVQPLNAEQNVFRMIDNTVENLLKKKTNGVVSKVKFDHKSTHKDGQHTKFLEVCLPDLHFGLTENEDENSLSAFEELFDSKIISILDVIDKAEPDMVDLVFLGDILHYDTAQKTTTKGTPQCSNVSFEKTFTTASEELVHLVNCVYNELAVHENWSGILRVIYVPGNHDTVLGYALMTVVGAYFHDVSNITFDLRQTDRKYTMYGTNLVGFIHGDMNSKRLNQWLYNDARHLISSAKQIEIHCGHLHSEQVVEDNNVITRHLPTICGVSPYEKKQGYHSVRRLSAFLWDGDEGLQNIFYI